MKNFLKWFGATGIKKYGLGLLITIACDIGLILFYDKMWTDGGDGATTYHFVMVLLGHLAIIGGNIGIIYHMITAFKDSK